MFVRRALGHAAPIRPVSVTIRASAMKKFDYSRSPAWLEPRAMRLVLLSQVISRQPCNGPSFLRQASRFVGACIVGVFAGSAVGTAVACGLLTAARIGAAVALGG